MARYVFPVPSRATICAFSMVTADGHLVYAQAKDTIEAMKEFEAAVAEGGAAALQEQVSGDSQSFIHWKTMFIHSLLELQFLEFLSVLFQPGKKSRPRQW